MNKYKSIYSSLITVFVLLLFNSLSAAENRLKPLSVFVSIQPQAYFVERIGGNRVAVNILLPPGRNPAIYAPAPAQMLKLSKASVYFRIGVPFENALNSKIANIAKQLRIVDTRKGIKLRKMERCDHNSHDHKSEGNNDPHIWMSPALVKIQAETIFKTLVELDPEGALEYRTGLISFLYDLDVLDKKIAQALVPVKGRSIFVFHPVFGYFADAYGLKQIAVEIEGKTPKGKNLSLFIKRAKEAGVRVIFVQPQFDPNTAIKIAHAINGVVSSIDPLGRDYITNMTDLAGKISEALE